MHDTINLSNEILEIHFNKDIPSVTIYWNWWFIIGFLLLFVLWYLFFNRYFGRLKDKFFLNKVKIKMKIGNMEIEKEITGNYQNKYIANRIYIELVTRKAAIPIDEANDVIIEIYNSWYSLFSIIRNEIKNLPGESFYNQKSSQDLIDLTIKILNDGLRPHLTKYQAKFRKWYDEELRMESNRGISPQLIQQKFSDYRQLISDIKGVNSILLSYKEELKKLLKA